MFHGGCTRCLVFRFYASRITQFVHVVPVLLPVVFDHLEIDHWAGMLRPTFLKATCHFLNNDKLLRYIYIYKQLNLLI
ncbi:hypothetical protein AL065_03260 [Pseudomonas amygdali pv. ulmi]|nr:hypothetical protein AL065_03260 [Pseudomonas amygdali pv. ulmi]PBQ09316.1 hypothetical protein CCL23_13015 [Pseudomonas syringae]